MTYRNPVIPGFHPDPSVCRVGDEYFLVTSSFIFSPGVPIFRSSNLVDWTQIGNVLDRPSQLDLTATWNWSSLGIYAPTIRHHDGRFFMITTNVGSSGRQTFLVTSEDPAGPWSDPVPVPVPGIDPDLAWDHDGNCWVHFSGLGGIARSRIDVRTGAMLTTPDLTWSGTGLQYPEAPHLYERDGTLVPAHRRGRDARRPLRLGRPRPVPARALGRMRRPTRSSPTAAPTRRFRTPATATWSRPPTGRGGWSARGATQGHRPRLPHARPGDLPRPGAVARRLAGAGRSRVRDDRHGSRTGRERARLTAREDFDAPTLRAHLGRPPPTPDDDELADGPPGLARPARWRGHARRPGADLRRAPPTTSSLPGQRARRRRAGHGGRAEPSGWTDVRTTRSPSGATASSPGPASDRSIPSSDAAPRPAGPVVAAPSRRVLTRTGPTRSPSASTTSSAPHRRWPAWTAAISPPR